MRLQGRSKKRNLAQMLDSVDAELIDRVSASTRAPTFVVSQEDLLRLYESTCKQKNGGGGRSEQPDDAVSIAEVPPLVVLQESDQNLADERDRERERKRARRQSAESKQTTRKTRLARLIQQHAALFPTSMRIEEKQFPWRWPRDTRAFFLRIYDEIAEQFAVYVPSAFANSSLLSNTRLTYEKNSRYGKFLHALLDCNPWHLGNDSLVADWRRLARRESGGCWRLPEVKHAELKRRAADDFRRSPSTAFYTHVEPSQILLPADEFGRWQGERRTFHCLCAANNTIVMCNNASHAHSLHSFEMQLAIDEACDANRDRLVCGRHNQNIVAAGTFGRNTRERWQQLVATAATCNTPPHSIALFNALESYMARSRELRGLRCCLATFTHRSHAEAARGTAADRSLSLLPQTREFLRRQRENRWEHKRDNTQCPATVDQAEYLDMYHPHHDRVDARDANQVTLALLLFVEATNSSLWHGVWSAWTKIVLSHCKKCTACRSALSEFLATVCVLDFVARGIIPIKFVRRIEKLLDAFV